MIDEPIIYATERLPNWPVVLKPYIGQRIIVIAYDNSWVQCGIIGDNGYINNADESWLYTKRCYCSISGNSVTKEDLFDFLLSNHPLHLEWLLFHQELLW